MSDSDSDCSGGGLTRLFSNPVPDPILFDFSPRDIHFNLKVQKGNGKFSKFVYTLRAGVPLPYMLNGDYKITFSKELKPSYKGKVGEMEMIKDMEFWVLTDSESSGSSTASMSLCPPIVVKKSAGPVVKEASKETPGSGTSKANPVDVSRDWSVNDSIESNVEDNPDEDEPVDQQNWKKLRPARRGSVDIDLQREMESILDSAKRHERQEREEKERQERPDKEEDAHEMVHGKEVEKEAKLTVYTNAGWLNKLKRSYGDLVISRCSQRTKEAVENNAEIKVTIFTF